MSDPVFVDTNVVVYARDGRAPAKQRAATEWLRALATSGALVVSPQVLNEAYVVFKNKLPEGSGDTVRNWLRHLFPFCTAPLDINVVESALAIEQSRAFNWWDCLIVASAAAAGCRYLLTEDLQDGQNLGDLRIVNPFLHPVESVLGPS